MNIIISFYSKYSETLTLITIANLDEEFGYAVKLLPIETLACGKGHVHAA